MNLVLFNKSLLQLLVLLFISMTLISCLGTLEDQNGKKIENKIPLLTDNGYDDFVSTFFPWGYSKKIINIYDLANQNGIKTEQIDQILSQIFEVKNISLHEITEDHLISYIESLKNKTQNIKNFLKVLKDRKFIYKFIDSTIFKDNIKNELKNSVLHNESDIYFEGLLEYFKDSNNTDIDNCIDIDIFPKDSKNRDIKFKILKKQIINHNKKEKTYNTISDNFENKEFISEFVLKIHDNPKEFRKYLNIIKFDPIEFLNNKYKNIDNTLNCCLVLDSTLNIYTLLKLKITPNELSQFVNIIKNSKSTYNLPISKSNIIKDYNKLFTSKHVWGLILKPLENKNSIESLSKFQIKSFLTIDKTNLDYIKNKLINNNQDILKIIDHLKKISELTKLQKIEILFEFIKNEYNLEDLIYDIDQYESSDIISKLSSKDKSKIFKILKDYFNKEKKKNKDQNEEKASPSVSPIPVNEIINPKSSHIGERRLIDYYNDLNIEFNKCNYNNEITNLNYFNSILFTKINQLYNTSFKLYYGMYYEDLKVEPSIPHEDFKKLLDKEFTDNHGTDINKENETNFIELLKYIYKNYQNIKLEEYNLFIQIIEDTKFYNYYFVDMALHDHFVNLIIKVQILDQKAKIQKILKIATTDKYPVKNDLDIDISNREHLYYSIYSYFPPEIKNIFFKEPKPETNVLKKIKILQEGIYTFLKKLPNKNLPTSHAVHKNSWLLLLSSNKSRINHLSNFLHYFLTEIFFIDNELFYENLKSIEIFNQITPNHSVKLSPYSGAKNLNPYAINILNNKNKNKEIPLHNFIIYDSYYNLLDQINQFKITANKLKNKLGKNGNLLLNFVIIFKSQEYFTLSHKSKLNDTKHIHEVIFTTENCKNYNFKSSVVSTNEIYDALITDNRISKLQDISILIIINKKNKQYSVYYDKNNHLYKFPKKTQQFYCSNLLNQLHFLNDIKIEYKFDTATYIKKLANDFFNLNLCFEKIYNTKSQINNLSTKLSKGIPEIENKKINLIKYLSKYIFKHNESIKKCLFKINNYHSLGESTSLTEYLKKDLTNIKNNIDIIYSDIFNIMHPQEEISQNEHDFYNYLRNIKRSLDCIINNFKREQHNISLNIFNKSMVYKGFTLFGFSICFDGNLIMPPIFTMHNKYTYYSTAKIKLFKKYFEDPIDQELCKNVIPDTSFPIPLSFQDLLTNICPEKLGELYIEEFYCIKDLYKTLQTLNQHQYLNGQNYLAKLIMLYMGVSKQKLKKINSSKYPYLLYNKINDMEKNLLIVGFLKNLIDNSNIYHKYIYKIIYDYLK